MALVDAQADCVIFYGESPAPIKLAGTVTKGDAVGYSGGWKRALATVATAIPKLCVASEDGVSGQVITAYFDKCILGGDRFSGSTAAGAVYVAEGTDSGEYIQVAPSDAGDVNTQIGIAIDATTIIIYPVIISTVAT